MAGYLDRLEKAGAAAIRLEMSKFFWLAFGAILALGGIALVATDNVAIGIVLIALSCAFDLLFVKDLLAEQRERDRSLRGMRRRRGARTKR